jgi:hypothetical protein
VTQGRRTTRHAVFQRAVEGLIKHGYPAELKGELSQGRSKQSPLTEANFPGVQRHERDCRSFARGRCGPLCESWMALSCSWKGPYRTFLHRASTFQPSNSLSYSRPDLKLFISGALVLYKHGRKGTQAGESLLAALHGGYNSHSKSIC